MSCGMNGSAPRTLGNPMSARLAIRCHSHIRDPGCAPNGRRPFHGLIFLHQVPTNRGQRIAMPDHRATKDPSSLLDLLDRATSFLEHRRSNCLDSVWRSRRVVRQSKGNHIQSIVRIEFIAGSKHRLPQFDWRAHVFGVTDSAPSPHPIPPA
jgi:hypothetical protein